MNREDKRLLRFNLKVELCRKDFWFFCHCLFPKMYTDSNTYLKEWCQELQDFYLNGITQDTLVLNAPPRHCKSLTLQLFVAWLLGINFMNGRTNMRIVVACYSQDISIKFSLNVKSFIKARTSINKSYIAYRDVFPMCSIKNGFDTKEEWRLEGSDESSFLATSPNGAATGFGCDVLIIDDMYKSITELYSRAYQESLETFVFNTLKTRFENEKKTIVGMTRWGKEDICGKIIDSTNPETIKILKYKALQDDGTMLNEKILSLEEYKNISNTMTPDAFLANYQQEFVSREGALYQNLKTYKPGSLPEKDEEGKYYQWPIYCVADLADKGEDYLCAIFYTIYDNHFYILDVYYTNKRMADTEEEFAKIILQNNCCYLLAESNNGGETYIRNVAKIYEKLGGKNCQFNTFFQKTNKESRILSQVSWIEKFVLLPERWDIYWPKFYVDLSDFNKEFRKNKHDDCADAITILGDCYNKTTKPVRAYVTGY